MLKINQEKCSLVCIMGSVHKVYLGAMKTGLFLLSKNSRLVAYYAFCDVTKVKISKFDPQFLRKGVKRCS